MNEGINKKDTVRFPRKEYLLIIFSFVLLILLILGGSWGWQQYQQRVELARMAEIQAESIARIEDEWGIRFTHIALLAQGGLIDMRYQVTDPDKAIYLFDEVENIPRVIASDGTVMSMNDDPHVHDLEFGLSYFFILRNINNAVKPGGTVTISVGDLELPYFQVEK